MADIITQASRVGERIPLSRLHPAVLNWLDQARGDRSPWFVAFSGGSDSLALLYLVWAHFPDRRSNLHAFHFNHALRGAESDEDERFCARVCESLQIAFTSGRWNHPPENPTENVARDARHAFFKTEMSKQGARILWLGHQMDDIAETHLMRLARGSGTSGLSAPRPCRIASDGQVLLRPLLSVSKKELQEALATAGAEWREDHTNTGAKYFRNRIRNTVTPLWIAAAENDALQGAALSRERLEEDDVALEAWLDLLPLFEKNDILSLGALAGKPRALWRRALHRWLLRVGSVVERSAFDQLLIACERGDGRISLHDGFTVVCNAELSFEKRRTVPEPWQPGRLISGISLLMPDGAELSVTPVEFSASVLARIIDGQVNSRTQAYIALFDGEFTARPWQPGDRYRPLNAPGSSKLQDLFTNRKIPVERRGELPVICAAKGEIIWVPGLPPADHCKVTPQCVTGLQLTYHSGTSTVPD